METTQNPKTQNTQPPSVPLKVERVVFETISAGYGRSTIEIWGRVITNDPKTSIYPLHIISYVLPFTTDNDTIKELLQMAIYRSQKVEHTDNYEWQYGKFTVKINMMLKTIKVVIQ